ncbi:gp53-like domain-containing protein [Escherichia coli]|uniref:gp53-like domain-containing protein n=1 Tax=Escherichia coli TaxID=562 RepID=UPI003B3BC681
MMPFARYFCIFINVGLGEAAKRDVGTGENQIPDISNFPFTKNNPLNFELPGGLILKAGYGNLTTQSSIWINFPAAFPNDCIAGGALSAEENTNDYVFAQTTSRKAGGLTLAFYRGGIGQPPTANSRELSFSWFAIGY